MRLGVINGSFWLEMKKGSVYYYDNNVVDWNGVIVDVEGTITDLEDGKQVVINYSNGDYYTWYKNVNNYYYTYTGTNEPNSHEDWVKSMTPVTDEQAATTKIPVEVVWKGPEPLSEISSTAFTIDGTYYYDKDGKALASSEGAAATIVKSGDSYTVTVTDTLINGLNIKNVTATIINTSGNTEYGTNNAGKFTLSKDYACTINGRADSVTRTSEDKDDLITVTQGTVELLGAISNANVKATGTSVVYYVSEDFNDVAIMTNIGTITLDTIAAATAAASGVTVKSNGEVEGLATTGDMVSGNGVTVTLTEDGAATATFADASGTTPAGVSAVTGKVTLSTEGGTSDVLFTTGTEVKAGKPAAATFDGTSLKLNSGVYSAIDPETGIDITAGKTSVSLDGVFTLTSGEGGTVSVFNCNGGLNGIKVGTADATVTAQGATDKPFLISTIDNADSFRESVKAISSTSATTIAKTTGDITLTAGSFEINKNGSGANGINVGGTNSGIITVTNGEVIVNAENGEVSGLSVNDEFTITDTANVNPYTVKIISETEATINGVNYEFKDGALATSKITLKAAGVEDTPTGWTKLTGIDWTTITDDAGTWQYFALPADPTATDVSDEARMVGSSGLKSGTKYLQVKKSSDGVYSAIVVDGGNIDIESAYGATITLNAEGATLGSIDLSGSNDALVLKVDASSSITSGKLANNAGSAVNVVETKDDTTTVVASAVGTASTGQTFKVPSGKITLTGGEYTSAKDVNIDTSNSDTTAIYTVVIGSGDSAITFGKAGVEATGAYKGADDVKIHTGQLTVGKDVATKKVNGVTYTDASTALTFIGNVDGNSSTPAYLIGGSVQGATKKVNNADVATSVIVSDTAGEKTSSILLTNVSGGTAPEIKVTNDDANNIHTYTIKGLDNTDTVEIDGVTYTYNNSILTPDVATADAYRVTDTAVGISFTIKDGTGTFTDEVVLTTGTKVFTLSQLSAKTGDLAEGENYFDVNGVKLADSTGAVYTVTKTAGSELNTYTYTLVNNENSAGTVDINLTGLALKSLDLSNGNCAENVIVGTNTSITGGKLGAGDSVGGNTVATGKTGAFDAAGTVVTLKGGTYSTIVDGTNLNVTDTTNGLTLSDSFAMTGAAEGNTAVYFVSEGLKNVKSGGSTAVTVTAKKQNLGITAIGGDAVNADAADSTASVASDGQMTLTSGTFTVGGTAPVAVTGGTANTTANGYITVTAGSVEITAAGKISNISETAKFSIFDSNGKNEVAVVSDGNTLKLNGVEYALDTGVEFKNVYIDMLSSGMETQVSGMKASMGFDLTSSTKQWLDLGETTTADKDASALGRITSTGDFISGHYYLEYNGTSTTISVRQAQDASNLKAAADATYTGAITIDAGALAATATETTTATLVLSKDSTNNAVPTVDLRKVSSKHLYVYGVTGADKINHVAMTGATDLEVVGIAGTDPHTVTLIEGLNAGESLTNIPAEVKVITTDLNGDSGDLGHVTVNGDTYKGEDYLTIYTKQDGTGLLHGKVTIDTNASDELTNASVRIAYYIYYDIALSNPITIANIESANVTSASAVVTETMGLTTEINDLTNGGSLTNVPAGIKVGTAGVAGTFAVNGSYYKGTTAASLFVMADTNESYLYSGTVEIDVAADDSAGNKNTSVTVATGPDDTTKATLAVTAGSATVTAKDGDFDNTKDAIVLTGGTVITGVPASQEVKTAATTDASYSVNGIGFKNKTGSAITASVDALTNPTKLTVSGAITTGTDNKTYIVAGTTYSNVSVDVALTSAEATLVAGKQAKVDDHDLLTVGDKTSGPIKYSTSGAVTGFDKSTTSKDSFTLGGATYTFGSKEVEKDGTTTTVPTLTIKGRTDGKNGVYDISGGVTIADDKNGTNDDVVITFGGNTYDLSTKSKQDLKAAGVSLSSPIVLDSKTFAPNDPSTIYFDASGYRTTDVTEAVATVTKKSDGSYELKMTAPLDAEEVTIDSVAVNITDGGTGTKYATETGTFTAKGRTASVDATGSVTDTGTDGISVVSGNVMLSDADAKVDMTKAGTSDAVTFTAYTKPTGAEITTQAGKITVTETGNGTPTTVDQDGSVSGLDGNVTLTGVPTGKTISTIGSGTVSLNGLSITTDDANGIDVSQTGTNQLDINKLDTGSKVTTVTEGMSVSVNGTGNVLSGLSSGAIVNPDGSVTLGAGKSAGIGSLGTITNNGSVAIMVDKDGNVCNAADGTKLTGGEVFTTVDSSGNNEVKYTIKSGKVTVVQTTNGVKKARVYEADGTGIKVTMINGQGAFDPTTAKTAAQTGELSGVNWNTGEESAIEAVSDVNNEVKYYDSMGLEITEPNEAAVVIDGTRTPKTVTIKQAVEDSLPAIELTGANATVSDSTGTATFDIKGATVSGKSFSVDGSNVITSANGTIKVYGGSITTSVPNVKVDMSKAGDEDKATFTAATKTTGAEVTIKGGNKITVTETGTGTQTIIHNDGFVEGLDGNATLTGVPAGKTVTTTGDGKVTINGRSYTLSNDGNGLTFTAGEKGISAVSGLAKGATLKMEDASTGGSLKFTDGNEAFTDIVSVDGIEFTKGSKDINVTLNKAGERFTDDDNTTYRLDTSGSSIVVGENGISGLANGTKVTVTDEDYFGGTVTLEVNDSILVITKPDGTTETYKQEDSSVPFTVDTEKDAGVVKFKVTGASTDTTEQAATGGFEIGGTKVATVTNGMFLDKDGNATTDESKAKAKLTIADDGDAVVYEGKTNSAQKIEVKEGTDAAKMEWAISTGRGADDININTSKDSIIDAGDGRNKVVVGSSGNSTVKTGMGNDDITIGGTGEALVEVAGGNNKITHTGTGESTLKGGSGNDTFKSTNENDTIIMGDGNNTLQMTSGVTNTISDYEYGKDKLQTATHTGELKLSDINVGADGTIGYGTTDGKAKVGADGQSVYAATLTDADGKYKVNVGWTGDEGGMIDASSLTEKVLLIGNSNGAKDTLMGGKGADTLKAGSGTSSLWGGAGNDLLISSSESSNEIFFLAGDGSDTVQGFTTYTDDTSDAADVLDFYGNGITGVEMTENGLKLHNGDSSMLVNGSYDENTMFRWKDGETEGVAKVGKKDSANSMYYDAAVTNYIGGKGIDSVKLGSDDGAVNVWMDGSNGSASYGSIEILDASSSRSDSTLAGGLGKETIVGSQGASSLWGGMGASADVLIGNGRTDFFYGLGNGNDSISGHKGDTVELFDMKLSDLTSAAIDTANRRVIFTTTAGDKVTVSGGVDSFKVDGQTWTTSYSGSNDWTLKQ